ncbi:MAG: protein O-GlcNAcase [Bacilli bacterium]
MIKLPLYIKDYYFMNSYVRFPNSSRLPLIFNSRTITFQMFYDYDVMLDKSKIDLNGLEPATLFVSYDRTLEEDAYHLEIDYKKNIRIASSTRRGIRYALSLLGSLIIIKENNVYLPIIKIDDYPSFKIRGIIEGFYGKPWTHEERLDEVDLMNKYRLNTYIYAPKDDEYHRKLWRELYPEKELNQLLDIKDKCTLLDIDFFYTISPGIDFDYSSEDNFLMLFRKLDQVIDKGVKYFGILMDDIDYKLKGKNKERFGRPGIAHAYIVNRVNRYLSEKVYKHKLVMCPTEYHQNHDGIYRHDLAKELDKDVAIFFTGDAVCAEVIDEATIKKVREDFDHPLFIWENHPVNDFLPSRLFTGPIQNRAKRMSSYVDGYITNPMNQWLASKVGIISIAYYAWNSFGYNQESVYEEILEYEFSNLLPDIKVFFDASRATVLDHYRNNEFYYLIEKEDYEPILKYYANLEVAVNNLKAKNDPLIKEIMSWLDWALVEVELVRSIINNDYKKDNLLKKLEAKERLGIEVLDYLIKAKNILALEEYKNLVAARRGNLWWRVWEEKK